MKAALARLAMFTLMLAIAVGGGTGAASTARSLCCSGACPARASGCASECCAPLAVEAYKALPSGGATPLRRPTQLRIRLTPLRQGPRERIADGAVSAPRFALVKLRAEFFCIRQL